MKDVVLLELAAKWERDAITIGDQNGSEEAKIPNAIARGRREAKKECADTLIKLIMLIGGNDGQ